MATDFEMFSGDDKVLSVSIVDAAGAAVDITGATAKWRLARSPADTALVIKATGGSGIVLTDEANGVLTVTIAAADTDGLKGVYYHELEITDGSGNISTVLAGKATVKPDLIV